MEMSAAEFARLGVFETPTKDGVFDLRTPLLKQGITTNTRARTEQLEICIKVYANGGENEMHSHTAEDHAFVVLSGQATFHVGTDENEKVLGMYQGIMLPQGTPYWFQSTEPNLVLLRVSAKIPDAPAQKLKSLAFIKERIEIPGAFFPDNLKG